MEREPLKTDNETPCRRCGHCCMTLFLALQNVPVDADTQEIGRWAHLHGCEPHRYRDGSLAIRVPLVCRWLELDEPTGRYRCRDYEHRPNVCRQYLCKAAKDDLVCELTRQHGTRI